MKILRQTQQSATSTMDTFRNRGLRALIVCTTCWSLINPSAINAGDGPFRLGGQTPTAVEELADRIDHMERTLDQHGSIVIKTPDVWGESRLMRHRSDVENQLRARLNSFEFRVNAAQATREAAFLAIAIALQEKIGGTDVAALTGAPTSDTKANSVTGATAGMIDNSGNTIPRGDFSPPLLPVQGKSKEELSVKIEPVIELDQVNRYLQHLNELRRLNEGDDNADAPGYALNLIRIPVSVLPGRDTEQGFGAEVQITIDPYISDEVLPLAFKDFVINGLVDRISYDVFQIASTKDIKDLRLECMNDQRLYQKSAPSDQTKAGSQSSNGDEEQGTGNTDADIDTVYQQLKARTFTPEFALKISKLAEVNSGQESASPADSEKFAEKLLDDKVISKAQVSSATVVATAGAAATRLAIDRYRFLHGLADINQQDLSIPASHRSTVDGSTLMRLALHSYTSLVHNHINPKISDQNEGDQDVPPSHRIAHGLSMPEVQSLMRREALAAYDFLSQPSASEFWSLFSGPEVARLIREHRRDLNGDNTLEFLLSKDSVDKLAQSFNKPEGEDQADIRVDPLDGLHKLRESFFLEMQRNFPQARNSVTEALVWQILIEAALVNDQLCRDMRETAALKNCTCLNIEWLPFYGPNPPPEASRAFREYVKCKWPIHVFALDPVTQDQNVADSFSQRREMQMALAIAAANQGLGAQALTRFVRRMEYDLETIELNRTTVAFSHGDNTFGWRFYPRVQSPPVPGNIRAIVNDLMIGGQSRDSLVAKRKLEPGIRECTALVVMPSFVPQVTVDVRSNYFRLARHTPIHQFMQRKPGYASSMELSKELTDLRRLQRQCVKDAHLYRDGEVFRLCKAVERLDDRLPLQTHHVTVPWENDLGGFELFRSGASMLEPELHGWYGHSGILAGGLKNRRDAQAEVARRRQTLDDVNLRYTLLGTPPQDTKGTRWEALEKEKVEATTALDQAQQALQDLEASDTSTAVYLVGKNFSVLNCRVIAGGVDVTGSIEVINRNLMQVRIPSTVSVVTTEHEPEERRFVIVHLATPHGATNRLLIPVDDEQGGPQSANVAQQVQEVKMAVDTVKADLSTAKEEAKREAREAIAVSDSDEVLTIVWWDSDGRREFDVNVYEGDTSIHVSKFCPPAKGSTSLQLVKLRGDSVWPRDDNTEEQETNLPIHCELAVRVTASEAGKDPVLLSVGPWEITNGNFQDGQRLTSEELLTRILSRAGDKIPCHTEKIEIQGYVRFRDGGRVTAVTGPLQFNLTHVSPPDSKE